MYPKSEVRISKKRQSFVKNSSIFLNETQTSEQFTNLMRSKSIGSKKIIEPMMKRLSRSQ